MHVDKIRPEIELYEHQVECVAKSMGVNSMLIADEMGVGKTLEALTIAALDFQLGRATKVLIVTPATIKYNWSREIRDLTHFTATVLDGTPAKRNKQLVYWMEDEVDILIVNYEQVASHLEQLNAIGFDIIVFDEAHYIKNPRSKRTKACHKLRGRRFFPMTGSPMLNKVDDLWSLLHVADPEQFPNFWRFRNRYCLMGGFKGKQVIGTKNKEELTAKLADVMIRRRKEDVLDLPDKIRVPIVVDLSRTQREMYDEIMNEWQYHVPDDPSPQQVENALVQLLRLKQVCSTPFNLTEDLKDGSAKLKVARDRVQELWMDGRSSVVFTQFRGTMKQFGRMCKDAHLPAFGIHGGMTPQARENQIANWKSDGGVFVAMLQIGGTGLTLTEADTVIFIDKLWTPAMNTQAEDRLHRIGQTNHVTVVDIQARDTIETRIEAILRSKTKLAEQIVEGAAGWKTQLVKELRKP